MNISYNSILITATASALFFSPAVIAKEKTASNDSDVKVSTEKKAKPKKITDRRHPDYIRCKSTAVIGSRIARNRVCMTNSQWAEANREGHRKSRQFVEDMQVGMNTSN